MVTFTYVFYIAAGGAQPAAVLPVCPVLSWQFVVLSYLWSPFFHFYVIRTKTRSVVMSTNECQNVFQDIQEGKNLRYAILKIIDGEIKLDKVR